jgi:hypothetical protein
MRLAFIFLSLIASGCASLSEWRPTPEMANHFQNVRFSRPVSSQPAYTPYPTQAQVCTYQPNGYGGWTQSCQ